MGRILREKSHKRRSDFHTLGDIFLLETEMPLIKDIKWQMRVVLGRDWKENKERRTEQYF